ncbi:hypothetical protein GCM10029964_101330 [Kibdelosporangium lantanae]
MTFTLLPAVDVVDGKAVRLVQGEAGTETGYGDPLDAARAWQRDGAEWLHMVDLDAAFGRGATTTSSPGSSVSWTCRWSSPAASGTTPRSRPRSRPAAPA